MAIWRKQHNYCLKVQASIAKLNVPIITVTVITEEIICSLVLSFQWLFWDSDAVLIVSIVDIFELDWVTAKKSDSYAGKKSW